MSNPSTISESDIYHYNPSAPFLVNGVILALCALVLVLFLHIPRTML